MRGHPALDEPELLNGARTTRESGRPERLRRVLYVHSGGHAPLGGVETLLEECLLRHRRYEAQIVLLDGGEFAEHLKRRFANVYVMGGGMLREIHVSARQIWTIAGRIRQDRVDVLLSPQSRSWIYAALAARLAGVPAIWAMHEMPSLQDLGVPGRLDLRAIRHRLGRQLRPAAFVANSQATAEGIRKVYGKNAPVSVAQPGVDVLRFRPGIDDWLRQDLGIPLKVPVISIIARVYEFKGQEYVLGAAPLVFNEFPETHFLIVGEPVPSQGGGQYLEKLRCLARESGRPEHVHFLGHRDDVPRIMAASDFIVHASVGVEAFGLSVIEGMAAGKAVIATSVGGPGEILTSGHDGLLVPPASSEAIAEAILTLLRDPDRRARMSEHARRTVEATYTIDSYVTRLEGVLDGVLTRPARSAASS